MQDAGKRVGCVSVQDAGKHVGRGQAASLLWTGIFCVGMFFA